jgi:hypothetical protein
VSPSHRNAFKNVIKVNVGAPSWNNEAFLEITAKPGDLSKALDNVGQVLNIFPLLVPQTRQRHPHIGRFASW